MVNPLTARALPSRRLSWLCAVAAALGPSCGTQTLEVRGAMGVSDAQVQSAMTEQLPPQLLVAVGGVVPAVWPPALPRLVMDLQVLTRARADLAAAGVTPDSYAGLRIKGVRCRTGVPAGGLLTPLPTEVLVFIGPLGSETLATPGVKRLARGAFPLQLGTGSAPGADAGPAITSVTNSLVLEPGASEALRALVLDSAKLELFVLLRVPVDTQVSDVLPHGGSDIDIALELELVP